MLLTLVLLLCSIASAQAQDKSTSKPDLQKVYQEALTWSKAKLETIPQPGVRNRDSGTRDIETVSKVCHGGQAKSPKILPITPGCKRTKQHAVKEVLDRVIDQEQNDQEQDVQQAQHTANTANKENTDKILVFVSFSMPQASLVALSKEAENYNAVLVMRGLKDDSFKSTQLAFAALGHDLRSGIEINPEAFETYHIKQVPVFVRVQSIQGQTKEIGRISGNISLSFAAQKLKDVM